jgi:hypothetical protein
MSSNGFEWPILGFLLLAFFMMRNADAKKVEALGLEDRVKQASAIFVGSIDSLEGRGPSDIEGVRYIWHSPLTVDKVLKGQHVDRIPITWEETNMAGEPEYKPGEKKVWLLLQVRGSFFVYRYDSVLPIDSENEVARILKS